MADGTRGAQQQQTIEQMLARQLQAMETNLRAVSDNSNAALAKLQTDNAALVQQLTDAQAAATTASNAQMLQIANALAGIPAPVPAPDLSSLTRTVAQNRPPLRQFEPNRPHSWSRTTRAQIQTWSDDHYAAINEDPVTNDTTDPPTLKWTADTDHAYLVSKDVFLALYIALPLTKQSKIDTELKALSDSRGDVLLQFSAYHAMRIIEELNEHLASSHLVKIQSLQLTDETQLERYILQLKTFRLDYLGSLPQFHVDARDSDISSAIVATVPLPLVQLIDSQMFGVPDSRRKSDRIINILETRAAQLRSRGRVHGSATYPANLQAVPVHAQHAPLAIGNYAEGSDHYDAHALLDSYTDDFDDSNPATTDSAYAAWQSQWQPRPSKGIAKGKTGKGKGSKGKNVVKGHKGKGSTGKGKPGKTQQPANPCMICGRLTHYTKYCDEPCWQPPCHGQYPAGSHDARCRHSKNASQSTSWGPPSGTIYSLEPDCSDPDAPYAYSAQDDYGHAASMSEPPTDLEQLPDYNAAEFDGAISTPIPPPPLKPSPTPSTRASRT
jgi:hypothetical protein